MQCYDILEEKVTDSKEYKDSWFVLDGELRLYSGLCNFMESFYEYNKRIHGEEYGVSVKLNGWSKTFELAFTAFEHPQLPPSVFEVCEWFSVDMKKDENGELLTSTVHYEFSLDLSLEVLRLFREFM